MRGDKREDKYMDMYSPIIEFEFKKWPEDFYEFAKLIKNYWREDYGYYQLWGNKLWLSTGGWSENESIMSAIDRNKTFNMVCWSEIKRGGHYKYELPKKNTPQL